MIICAASDIIQLLPNFQSGCQKLHDLLMPVAVLFCGLGVMIHGHRLQRGGSVNDLGVMLVRLAVVVLLCAQLGAIGDAINDGVWDLVQQTGFSWNGANPGGVYQDLVDAIRNKWGTNGVAQGNKQLYDRVNSQGTAQTTGGYTPINTTVHFTHYAYPGDSTPDWNSSHGIGNHNNRLVAGQSVALSKNIADQYGLQVGQTVQFTTADGRTITGRYDDTVGNYPGTNTPIPNVVDIYDPQNQYADLSGVGITGLNGLGVQNNDNGGSNWFSNALGWVGRLPEMGWMAFWSGFVWVFAVIAAGVLWCLEAVRQILYEIEIGVSPLFISMLAVPALAGIGTRFLSYLAAVILWPIGAAVMDLVTKAIVDLAVNPTGNVGQQIAISLGGLGIWIVLGIWVIFSSLAVPIVAHKFLAGGGSGVGGLLGTAFGVSTVSQAQRQAHKSAIMAASAMRSALTTNGNVRQNLPTKNGSGENSPAPQLNNRRN